MTQNDALAISAANLKAFATASLMSFNLESIVVNLGKEIEAYVV